LKEDNSILQRVAELLNFAYCIQPKALPRQTKLLLQCVVKPMKKINRNKNKNKNKTKQYKPQPDHIRLLRRIIT